MKRILLLLIITCFIVSCKNDKDGDGIDDKIDKCPDTPLATRVDKKGCPIELKINQIHFYIENSGSMNGYFKGNTGFINNIGDILTTIDGKKQELITTNTAKKINTYFIAEKTEKHIGDVSSFRNKIATQNVIDKTSSPLDKIFSTITNVDSNDLVLLVSDCILSGTDEQIRSSANRNFNIDQAESLLKNNIQEAFIKLHNKKFAATLLGYRSKFNGIYYDYQNTKTNLENTPSQRPYYIWIIGNKEIVAKVKKELLSVAEIQPELNIDFGLIDEPIKAYHLLFAKYKTGDWEYDINNIKNIDVPKNSSMNFAIAIDLSKLPTYASDIDYLKKHLIIEGGAAKIKLQDIKTNDDIYFGDLSDHFNIIKNPHILIFSVTELKKDEVINIKLPLEYPTEYKNWSTMNDIGLANQQDKTFAFEHLVNGVRKSYENKNLNNYINISINLKK